MARPDTPAPAPPPVRRSPLIHLLQGLLMGSADIVPGVSGGTVALIVGIYERLVDQIRAATSLPFVLLREGGRAARVALAGIDWWFLIPLGVGILTAIGIGAKVIPPFMEAYPVESRALFFGLVAASLVIPWRRIRSLPWWGYAAGLVALVAAFVFVGLPIGHTTEPSLLRVFGSAAVAICAMILPGVSGAFLLKVLGIYEPTLHALNELNVAYVLVFILGAATGITLFSKLLSYLLDRHHDLTMIVLVGLLAGSLRALWPWLGEVRVGDEVVHSPSLLLAPPADLSTLWVIAVAVLGFAIVSGLTWLGARRGEV